MVGSPLGVQDFKIIRENDLYYVDKTKLISNILTNVSCSQVHLYTRPRRFGKSVNLSMIDAYFNMEYSGNRWFDGLYVSEHHPDDPHKNSYPVIYLDMREMGNGTYVDFHGFMIRKISKLYSNFGYLLESERIEERDKRMMRSIIDLESNDWDYRLSLLNMCGLLKNHHGVNPIILIDEYDNAVNDAVNDDERRMILDFVGPFLSSALKANENVQFSVITGILQITKESIFSGLNNLIVDNIFTSNSDELFGFSEEEVVCILEDHGRPEKIEEVKAWYDGYRFGDVDIFNPWSIFHYINNRFEPASYWAGTSGNSIIRDLLNNTDENTFDNLISLSSGGYIEAIVDPAVSFDDMSRSSGSIYSLLAMSGYLKATKGGLGCYDLSIPNHEMATVFSTMLSAWLGEGIPIPLLRLSKALKENDVDAIGTNLYAILSPTMSLRVLDNEKPYQAFLAGLLFSVFGNYDVEADYERGEGYFDILLRRIRGTGPHIVIEIKRESEDRSADSLRALAKSALYQIKERDYTQGLSGRVIAYGIAFHKKTPFIESEEMW